MDQVSKIQMNIADNVDKNVCLRYSFLKAGNVSGN